MALKIIGDSGYEVNSSTDKALYVESRPGSLRSFSAGVISNQIFGADLGGTPNIACIYWTHPTDLCLVKRISIGTVITTGITSGVQFDISVFFARSFTKTPTNTNGIFNFQLGGNYNKLNTFSTSSLVGFLSVTDGHNSSTDMGGTYVADTNPLTRISTWSGTTMGTLMFNSAPQSILLDRTGYGQYPIVLAKNEGLVLTFPASPPADGQFKFKFCIDWQERGSY